MQRALGLCWPHGARAVPLAVAAAMAASGTAAAGCRCASVISPDGGDGAVNTGFESGVGLCITDAGLLCLPEEGVYVDVATGSDTNPGTQALPARTIGRGIELASASFSPKSVFISNGTYEETVALANGVSLYGGFAASAGWARDATLYTTEIRGGTVAMTATGITATTYLDGLVIVAATATNAGESSIGLLASATTGLLVHATTVRGGAGAPGVAGAGGMSGGDASPGGTGEAGCEDSGGFCSSCSRPT